MENVSNGLCLKILLADKFILNPFLYASTFMLFSTTTSNTYTHFTYQPPLLLFNILWKLPLFCAIHTIKQHVTRLNTILTKVINILRVWFLAWPKKLSSQISKRNNSTTPFHLHILFSTLPSPKLIQSSLLILIIFFPLQFCLHFNLVSIMNTFTQL